MRVISVNVGLPREIVWQGDRFSTGIFKEPVSGRVAVRSLNLDGDRQADLTVHGGRDKAVYIYPSEHYGFWRGVLNRDNLPYGSFGENLTLEGVAEDDIHIGDRLLAGTAELVITQPRIPCFKLAAKFDRPEIGKEFLQSGRSGFYAAVVREGEVGVGDACRFLARDPGAVRIADLNRLLQPQAGDRALMIRALAVEALAESWRSMLNKRLSHLPG